MNVEIKVVQSEVFVLLSDEMNLLLFVIVFLSFNVTIAEMPYWHWYSTT